MYLILCSSTDLSAMWAHTGLQLAGLDNVELLTSEALSSCTLWEHRVGRAGVETSFRLPSGTTLHSGEVKGLLNRLPGAPQELLPYADASDRDYAMQEFSAFYLSWLHGIPGAVFNPPTPQGLAGRWQHASEWAIAAHQAGFTVPDWRQETGDPPERGYLSLAPAGAAVTRVVMLGGEVFGAEVPDAVRARCKKLAEISGTPLIGIDLFAGPTDPWTFAGATPMPDLQIGGPAFISKLAELFQNGGIQ